MVGTRNLHTDWVGVVLAVQVVEACVHQVAVVDTVDILALMVAEGSFEEDTVDVRSVVLLAVDEDYKSEVVLVSVGHMFAW